MEIFNKTLELINENITDKLAKYKLEKSIILLWQNITDDTEVFWREFVILKDLFSFKFNKREFPIFKEEFSQPKTVVNDNDLNLEKETNKEKHIRKQEMFLKIKSKYGRKSTVLKMLNEDYTDESDDKVTYKVLQNYKYYQMFSLQDLLYLLNKCKEKELYNIILLIFLSLCCSREYCHYVFQNEILDLLFNDSYYIYNKNPFKTEKYLQIIHHCLFYGFYMLYLEECVIKSQAYNHRHILDFEAMGKIPNYLGGLDQHPFIPLTLSSEYLHAKNVHPDDYIIKPINFYDFDRGVYSIYSFWKRFDIFTNGIFRGIKMDKIYFGGSVMAACGIRNPLEKLFDCDLDKDSDLLYLNTALPDEPAYEIYLNRINKLFSKWNEKKSNLRAYFNEYYPSKTVLTIDVDDDIKLLELEDNLADIDIKIDVVDDAEFDKITYQIFQTVKNNLGNPTDSKMLQLIKVCSNKSYKYYISGMALHRSIEIYRLYVIHPIGGVSRFHFACVRGVAVPTDHLNGILFGRVLCHPSFYSFAFTGILTDYKWMAHGTSAIELILKYYSRGCVVLLNAKEHKKITEYISSNFEKWGTLFKSNNGARFVSINSPIFKPRQQKYGIYYNISNMNIIPYHEYKYVETSADFMHKWQQSSKLSDFNFDFSLRTQSGHINTIFTWQILPYLKL